MRLARRLRRAPFAVAGDHRLASPEPARRPLRAPRAEPLRPVPAPGAAGIAPSPLGRTRPIRLSWAALSFVALVLLPVAAAAGYLFVVASDQYVAEFRFTLRAAEPPRIGRLSLLAGATVQSPAAMESQILVQYIASRAVIDDIGGGLDLRRLFSPGSADWWSRLRPPVSVEELVHYWQGQVDPFYDPADGTVTVRARAFAPQDALYLAQAILGACEKLVNELSLRARRDALAEAEAELDRAQQRLAAALGELRAFRDRQGLIDPVGEAQATRLLDGRLREEAIRAKAELATLRNYLGEDAPSIKVLSARIRSLEKQRRGLARELTDPDPTRAAALSHVLGTYEQLESERKFAETAYQSALRRLDEARADADRQHVFIASFVPPRLPEEALYPRRWRTFGTVALIAFALWAIGGLVVQSARDHLM